MWISQNRNSATKNRHRVPTKDRVNKPCIGLIVLKNGANKPNKLNTVKERHNIMAIQPTPAGPRTPPRNKGLIRPY